MAKKPVSGLSAGMLVTEPAIDPRAASLEAPIAATASPKDEKPITTTVKLSPALYRRLKAYNAANRTNGQVVSVEAIEAFLTDKGY